MERKRRELEEKNKKMNEMVQKRSEMMHRKVEEQRRLVFLRLLPENICNALRSLLALGVQRFWTALILEQRF
jgi:hypothetical protein